MGQLKKELWYMVKSNKDGSYGTQAERKKTLFLIAEELSAMGFKGMGKRSLKPKHVEALVEKWQSEGKSNGTMKNRMASLRWWADNVHKSSVVKPNNEDYGIGHRVYVTNETKAVNLDSEKLAKISDPNIVFSLRLQAAFGLRREEAMKFNASYADRGMYIQLKDSWTKGGKSRIVPFVNDEQRALINEIKHARGTLSLIDENRNYRQQMKKYENETAAVGLHKMHGLRHAYAQRRYKELSGWESPAAGGPRIKDLSREQKAIDHDVRLKISAEMGHERKSIIAVYIGS